MNPYFSLEEYKERYSRIIELMKVNNLTALFLTNEKNINYLSGCQPFQPWYSTTRPTILIIPLEGQPVLVVHSVWKGAAYRDSWISDIREYVNLDGVPKNMILAIFNELRLKKGIVGIETGLEQRMGLPFRDFIAIKDSLKNVKWFDASEMIWKVRSIKSVAEIECMRKASSAVMEAFNKVFPRLRPGLTQETVVHWLQSAVCEAGADFGFIIPTWNSETYLSMSCLPNAEKIKRGDFIWVDMGAIYHGYWCDFCRAVSLGIPSDETLRLWEAINRVTMKGVESVKPGVSVHEIVQTCAEESKRQGLELNFAAGRMGHGCGLMLTEPPSFTLAEETILETGMTINLEPGIVSENGVFIIEQNLAVTKEGHDLLSKGPWEIWVV